VEKVTTRDLNSAIEDDKIDEKVLKRVGAISQAHCAILPNSARSRKAAQCAPLTRRLLRPTHFADPFQPLVLVNAGARQRWLTRPRSQLLIG
jgi:hypothetical protein